MALRWSLFFLLLILTIRCMYSRLDSHFREHQNLGIRFLVYGFFETWCLILREVLYLLIIPPVLTPL
jgi:hypothetical protein